MSPNSSTGPNGGAGVRRIGGFEVTSVLGNGGMGIVYRAEQTHPVRREVALKVLSSSQGSARAIARMEAEWQALALMNHPGIATVFDAGTTDDGMPYFAMELVKGAPITEFADREQLGLKARLDLFLEVCDAVQHAHQKMVIHRDLKPSNVLVAMEDGRSIPKLIDFGIAKGLDSPLVADASLATREGLPIGTPQYMSPEQVETDPLNLDARVDVYALGILLYELLAGIPPLEVAELDAWQLMMQVLKIDFPRPSQRFSGLGRDAQTTISKARGETPAGLMKWLKSDLEWIITKAIEKDRDRRYGAVAELRADILRFLENRPVTARPPSLTYRIRRFVRRYRVAVAAGVIVLGALVTGLTVSTVSMIRARNARDAAIKSQTKADATVQYLRKVLASVEPGVDGRQIRVVDVLTRASEMITADLGDQPEVEASVRKTIGLVLLELGSFERSGEELERAVEIQRAVFGETSPETLHTENAVGRQLYKMGKYNEAARIHRSVLERQIVLFGREHNNPLWTMYNLAKALHRAGEWEAAEAVYKENIAIRKRVLGEEHLHTLISTNGYGLFLAHAGRIDEGLEVLQHNHEVLKRVAGARHPDTLRSEVNLVEALNLAGRWREAEAQSRATLPEIAEVLGAEHPEVLDLMAQLSRSLAAQERFTAAEVLQQRVLEYRTAKLGEDHPETLESELDLCLIRQRQEVEGTGDLCMPETLQHIRSNLAPGNWQRAVLIAAAARYYREVGLDSQANELFEECRPVFEKHGRQVDAN